MQAGAAERNAERVGRVEQVLVEGPSRTDPALLRGRTRRNTTVNFAGSAQPGDLVDVADRGVHIDDAARPRLVWDEERSAGEIASQFEVTRPAVSQHLTVLKEAGLVNERRNGTKRLYRARPEGLIALQAFLDEFWGDRLEALKREAEREERKHGKRD